MCSEKAKILILVEGAKLDVKLMAHLLSIYGISQSHQIVSYKTNIYDLYQHMFIENEPDAVDLLQLLKEREPNPANKAIFDAHYSDILLIFDLDPQDTRFSSEKITQMINYFVESSDMGKLYLNYPMVEAFYHMRNIPDDDYNTYEATLLELQQHKYKDRVIRENRNHRFSKFAVDRSECNIIIHQNIAKAHFILSADTDIDLQAHLLPDAARILAAQLVKLQKDRSVFVLSTCVFYIPEYNPNLLKDSAG